MADGRSRDANENTLFWLETNLGTHPSLPKHKRKIFLSFKQWGTRRRRGFVRTRRKCTGPRRWSGSSLRVPVTVEEGRDKSLQRKGFYSVDQWKSHRRVFSRTPDRTSSCRGPCRRSPVLGGTRLHRGSARTGSQWTTGRGTGRQTPRPRPPGPHPYRSRETRPGERHDPSDPGPLTGPVPLRPRHTDGEYDSSPLSPAHQTE